MLWFFSQQESLVSCIEYTASQLRHKYIYFRWHCSLELGRKQIYFSDNVYI
jgi:hypothetical protein